jgi:chaperonin GroEL (HSP60 family)
MWCNCNHPGTTHCFSLRSKHLRCREKNQLECRKLYFWPKFQVGAQTIIEMKDKKLRIEDALNATRVA